MSRRSFIEETCVFYDSSDAIVGRALAYASLTPPFLVIMYCSLGLVVRDTLVLWAFAGQLMGAVITAIAKRIIDQSRPDESEVGGGGMPSNHSQFVCFFATFYIMCFFFKCPALDRLFRVIYSLGLVMLACAVTFSRAYLKYHTINQAVAGALLGTALGYSWFQAYFAADVQKSLRFVCKTRLFQWLRINFVEVGDMDKVRVIPEVLDLKEEIVSNRRWFHQFPELAFQEVRTAAKVAELLRSYGITEIWEGVGRTGVVALIRGAHPGNCCALRADMDGLAITEIAEVPYRSQNPGVMHACGHDGHMASLLAAAKVLQAQRDHIHGVVKLLFQPAEEGLGGAREMIADGCLEEGPHGPRVDSVYGIHLWSPLEVSRVGCKHGPCMASSDAFEINVKGLGGHGAMPQGTVDAIVEAAHVVTALQTVISRNKNPLDSGVITCGTINGGYGYNIIADHVKITGTCRTFKTDVQELIKGRMNDVCCGVARTFGGEIDLKYKYGYPPTDNKYPECVDIVKKAAAKILGDAESSVEPVVTMGAEDFSYYLLQRPGCFFFVGAALPGEVRPHHRSVFDFDEDALLISASMFVEIVRDVLA